MPIPVYQGVGASVFNAAAITPSMPAGVLAGDILLCHLETSNQAITLSGGTETWTEVPSSPQGVGVGPGTDAVRHALFWARASQDNPTSPTTSDSGNHQFGYITFYRGAVATGDPINASSGGTDASVDNSGSVPGATTTQPDCLVVISAATALPDLADTGVQFSAWANADLANLTERVDRTMNAGDGGGMGVVTGEKATAGAYGATTYTTAQSTVKAHITVAIQGAATAPVKARRRPGAPAGTRRSR